MHFRGKKNINCKFYDSCPTGAVGIGQKLPKFDIIQKSSSLLLHNLKKKNEFIVMQSRKHSTKILKFISPGIGVLTLGRGQNGHICLMFKNFLLKILLLILIETDCILGRLLSILLTFQISYSPEQSFDSKAEPNWSYSVNVYNV